MNNQETYSLNVALCHIKTAELTLMSDSCPENQLKTPIIQWLMIITEFYLTSPELVTVAVAITKLHKIIFIM